MPIGILAYGSLIDDPGELAVAIADTRTGLRTPFRVEFARTSSTRGGAPTLVPVQRGGAHVDATLLILHSAISLTDARDLLYRRETRQADPAVRYQPDPSRKNQVWVEVIPNWAELDFVLYTRIRPNISDLSPGHLAELAIRSARGEVLAKRKDGITYLIRAKAAGVRTPLSHAYEREILSRSQAASLEEALTRLQQANARASDLNGR